ncbi:hypothetical protein GCM10009634_58250 [Saccharothrix xinjiangensis]
MVTPERGTWVRNLVSGTVGEVVQAGVVHGGIHLNAPAPARVAPRQLPAAPGVFAGRVAELAALDRALAPAGPAVVPLSVIGGAGGVGKTWLALTWAHRNLHRFPDGQLFADLRGFGPTGRPVEPAGAVRGFLTALGADPDRLPPDLDALSALYRALIAGRRVLVVLDNAATTDQVVPLLPGSPTCAVLVTGRATLASLIDRHGARHLSLDVLTRAESRDLLTARLGAGRVDAEPDVADELVALCGGHPLALAITARQAATRPAIPLAGFAAELRELGLEALDHDTDPAAGLPTVLSWSLHHLTDRQRAVFALLGTAPGPDTDLPAATALTGLPRARTREVLRALEDHCLLERRPHGRYRMHDLIRAYANTCDTPARQAALERVVDFYLHTASAAAHLLDPHHAPIRPDPPRPRRPPPTAARPPDRAGLAGHPPHPPVGRPAHRSDPPPPPDRVAPGPHPDHLPPAARAPPRSAGRVADRGPAAPQRGGRGVHVEQPGAAVPPHRRSPPVHPPPRPGPEPVPRPRRHHPHRPHPRPPGPPPRRARQPLPSP